MFAKKKKKQVDLGIFLCPYYFSSTWKIAIYIYTDILTHM